MSKEKINKEVKLDDKAYTRTLQFIFIKASLDLFKESVITIEHSIGRGIFGEIRKTSPLVKDDILKIKAKMEEIIKKDLPINKIKVKKEEAINIFKSYKMNDKVLLLNQTDFEYVNLYELDGRYDYFYGKMALSTGAIKAYDLMYYEPGYLLIRPDENDFTVLSKFVEQKKMSKIFRETEKWLDILGVGAVGALNDKIENGELINLIMT